jgi:hypothetical protein
MVLIDTVESSLNGTIDWTIHFQSPALRTTAGIWMAVILFD